MPPRLAVDPHAAMGAHHVVDDGEPEAGALRTGAGVGLDAIELLKDLALESRWNADAVITHVDDAEAVERADLDGNLALLG
jgi:hypothetical protein